MLKPLTEAKFVKRTGNGDAFARALGVRFA